MKTLKEHNEEIMAKIREGRKPAGVLCDECKVEMVYPASFELSNHSTTIWIGLPTGTDVICPKCDARGRKLD